MTKLDFAFVLIAMIGTSLAVMSIIMIGILRDIRRITRKD